MTSVSILNEPQTTPKGRSAKKIKLPHDGKGEFNPKNGKKDVVQVKFVESEDSDDDVEFFFKPREYFVFSLCHVCKATLSEAPVECDKCGMIFYCSKEHRAKDEIQHQQFCLVLTKLAKDRGGHIFKNSDNLNFDAYRAFRINIIRVCERYLQRQLFPFEKEMILYPKLCNSGKCRNWKKSELSHCNRCKGVTFCTGTKDHLCKEHKELCRSFFIFSNLTAYESKFGKITPPLPTKVFDQPFERPLTMREIFTKLNMTKIEKDDGLIFTTVTQLSSPPLTTWLCAKIAGQLHKNSLVIHLIGAEVEFEGDVLRKWESFFLHMTPSCKDLKIIFVGPELHLAESSPFEESIKLCNNCKSKDRSVKFVFQNNLYHDYAKDKSYQIPDIVCFFNPGLHRLTGFGYSDTWPETIKSVVSAKCPIIVTSYTQYESPLDLKRFLRESQRKMDILLPPSVNLYCSQRPERNFISEESAPFIFKNFYCFIIQ